MTLPIIKVNTIHYQKNLHLAIYFDYSNELKALVKSIEGTKWSWEKKCWHLEFTQENLETIKRVFKSKAEIELNLPAKAMLPPVEPEDNRKITDFKRWMEHIRYSPSTIKTYCSMLEVFVRFIKPKPIAEATN